MALFIICALAAPWISASPASAAGTASGPGTARPADKMAPDIVDRVISSSKEHLGKPYKFRNEYGRVMDCGGFMSYVWSLHGVTLPHSSRDIAHQVDRVPLDKAEKGDLLFFKGRRKFLHRVGHVSMVIGREGGRIRMIHSCARGVVIDEYPVEYYSERFLFAGRIPGLPRDTRASAADSTCGRGERLLPGLPRRRAFPSSGSGTSCWAQTIPLPTICLPTTAGTCSNPWHPSCATRT